MHAVRIALSLVCLALIGCGKTSPAPSSAPTSAKSSDSDGDVVLPAPKTKKK